MEKLEIKQNQLEINQLKLNTYIEVQERYLTWYSPQPHTA
jgi:hypothetical protein